MVWNPLSDDEVSDRTLTQAGTLLEAANFQPQSSPEETALTFAETQVGTRDRAELHTMIDNRTTTVPEALSGIGSAIGTGLGATLGGLATSGGGLILLAVVAIAATVALGRVL